MKKNLLLLLSLALTMSLTAADNKGKPSKTDKTSLAIEAENYDNGGEGVSFRFADQKHKNSHREEQKVSLSSYEGILHVNNTSSGDWLNYTFDCKTNGKYNLKLRLASHQNGRFYISLDDGAYKSKEIAAGTGEWQKYEDFIIPAIELSAGKHTMTFHILDALNFDKFEFVKVK